MIATWGDVARNRDTSTLPRFDSQKRGGQKRQNKNKQNKQTNKTNKTTHEKWPRETKERFKERFSIEIAALLRPRTINAFPFQ